MGVREHRVRDGSSGWADRAGEIRREVVTHLRASFGEALDEHEREDIAQEAIEALLRHERSGHELDQPTAYAKKAAWRDAQDLIRAKRSSTGKAIDPQGYVLQGVADARPGPEARLMARAELSRAIEVAERLKPEQQLVYRARFVEELSPREACKRFGIGRPTYYWRLNAAVEKVERSLRPERFAQLERQLIGAYVAGTATPREVRRARRLIEADPHAAALARELLTLHRGAAAALPAPVLDQAADLSLFERAGHSLASLRDRVFGSDHSPEQIAAQLGGSGAGRAAGVGLGGVAAHFGALGGAGKLALACLGAGAVTTACILGGVLPGDPPERARAVEESPAPRRASPAPNPALVERLPSPDEPATETQERKAPATSDADETTASDSVSPAVSPEAPAVEQEFGVASAAPAPSAADAPGGTASSTDVQQEFGP
jgi:RNA polymerase sigma factor (sigma-70 family)